jgi:hypothetical protein
VSCKASCARTPAFPLPLVPPLRSCPMPSEAAPAALMIEAFRNLNARELIFSYLNPTEAAPSEMFLAARQCGSCGFHELETVQVSAPTHVKYLPTQQQRSLGRRRGCPPRGLLLGRLDQRAPPGDSNDTAIVLQHGTHGQIVGSCNGHAADASAPANLRTATDSGRCRLDGKRRRTWPFAVCRACIFLSKQ